VLIPGDYWSRPIVTTQGGRHTTACCKPSGEYLDKIAPARPLQLKADPGAGVSTRAECFDDHGLRPADLRREGLYCQPGLLGGRRREREQLRCFTGTKVSGLVNATIRVRSCTGELAGRGPLA
jgi:hypothetical protein